MIHNLLDGRYEPITSEIGFLECDTKSAVDAYVHWMRPIQASRGIELDIKKIQGDFVARILNLLPLTGIECRRNLFLPTRGKWTAYLDNGWRGTDVYSAVSYLCGVINCRGIRAVSVPHTIKKCKGKWHGNYGATMLEVYAAIFEDGEMTDTTVRSIYSANDGGRWKFGAHGEPFEFEELEQYTKPRIQDRFTPDMLDRYLRNLGIEFFSPEFFEVPQPAYLISKVGPTVKGMISYTLEEARA